MGEDGPVEHGRLGTAAPTTRGIRRRSALTVATVAACLALVVAGCSSDNASSPAAPTTTAAKPSAAKAGFEFAAAPKGPIGPDSSQENKCFGLKAFRYLVAMPNSGKYFKDKLADKPKDADTKVQALGKQLQVALPEIAADIKTLADDAHKRLQQPEPSSGLAMLGSDPDKHLISYLTSKCASGTTSA